MAKSKLFLGIKNKISADRLSLTSTTKLSNSELTEPYRLISDFYNELDFINKMVGTVLNAAFTESKSVFMLSTKIMESLVETDENLNRKTLNRSEFYSLMKRLKEGVIAELRPPVKGSNKSGLYRISNEELRKYFNNLDSEPKRVRNYFTYQKFKLDESLYPDLFHRERDSESVSESGNDSIHKSADSPLSASSLSTPEQINDRERDSDSFSVLSLSPETISSESINKTASQPTISRPTFPYKRNPWSYKPSKELFLEHFGETIRVENGQADRIWSFLSEMSLYLRDKPTGSEVKTVLFETKERGELDDSAAEALTKNIEESGLFPIDSGSRTK